MQYCRLKFNVTFYTLYTHIADLSNCILCFAVRTADLSQKHPGFANLLFAKNGEFILKRFEKCFGVGFCDFKNIQ